MTGTLEKMSRSEAGELIKSLGGKVSSSVSKNTDFVVAGEKSGSKEKKARELSLKIIDEKTFFQMIGEEN